MAGAPLGPDPRVASTLAYAAWWVSGLVVWMAERDRPDVRFHAAQGLALHIAIMIVHTIFSVIGAITDSTLGGTFFKLAAFVFLVISMARVWKGEPNRIAPLEEPGKWFNRHIEPRDKG